MRSIGLIYFRRNHRPISTSDDVKTRKIKKKYLLLKISRHRSIHPSCYLSDYRASPVPCPCISSLLIFSSFPVYPAPIQRCYRCMQRTRRRWVFSRHRHLLAEESSYKQRSLFFFLLTRQTESMARYCKHSSSLACLLVHFRSLLH